MNEQQKMVQEFMEKARQHIPLSPTIPHEKVRGLRIDLIQEELDELHLAFEHYKSLRLIADAIGDLLYVVYGTAVSCGIDIEPIFTEIHRSNMSKFIDGTFREDGKYLKGPSYSKPNLKPILEKQGM